MHWLMSNCTEGLCPSHWTSEPLS